MSDSIETKKLEKFKKDYITLDKKDIEACSKSRESFISQFKKKVKDDKDGPQLYSEEPTINFGSRFDGTQYGDLDEMDIMLVIDSNNGYFYTGEKTIGNGLGIQSPNHKYDSKFKKDNNSGVSGTKLLNWVKGIATDIIENGYSASVKPKRDGQAVTVEVKSLGLSFDLVLAGIFEHTEGKGDFYNIPDGKASNGWILTNPKADKAMITDLNSEKENFCDVIRVIKFIRDYYNITLSSHIVKSSVADYAENKNYGLAWKDDFWIDLKGSLSHLESSLREKHVPDLLISYTTGVHENLISGIDNNEVCAGKVLKVIDRLKSVELAEEGVKYKALVAALSNDKIVIKSDSRSLSEGVFSRNPVLDELFL